MQKITLNNESVSTLEGMLLSEPLEDKLLALSMMENVHWGIASFAACQSLILPLNDIQADLSSTYSYRGYTFMHNQSMFTISEEDSRQREAFTEMFYNLECKLEQTVGRRVRSLGFSVTCTTYNSLQKNQLRWQSWSAIDDLIRFFRHYASTDLIQAFNRSRGDKRTQIHQNGTPPNLQVIPNKYKNRPHGR